MPAHGKHTRCARSTLYTCQAHAKHARSRAPAQHCTHARHMVSTPAQENPLRHMESAPAQEHLLSTVHNTHARHMVSTPAQEHPLSTFRHMVSTPAQHCTHARHMLVQEHPLSTAFMPATSQARPLKSTHSAPFPCQAHGKHTRSRAPAQHCTHSRHMVSTPAQEHPLRHMESAPAPPVQRCIHARHMVSTPAQEHPLSIVSMPGTW